jgi:hypothetical protein
MFLALPMMTTAAPVIDPVEEVACVVMVTPTSGDRFRIDDVESRFSYATAGECQQDLLEFDVLPGDTVTIDDVPRVIVRAHRCFYTTTAKMRLSSTAMS